LIEVVANQGLRLSIVATSVNNRTDVVVTKSGTVI
jgi:hypothetical protein